MGLISWVLFGALIGWLSSKIVGTDGNQGWIANIVLSIIGAVLGGAIFSFIFDDSFSINWSIGSFLVALGGGIIVSAGYSALSRGR
jgi:uncharacterized membrane protein YeaQ/YmgE (transglycosylase-associated protein family)